MNLYKLASDPDENQRVVEYLERLGIAKRVDINCLLLGKLPDVLDENQKSHKIKNPPQSLKNQLDIEIYGKIWRMSKPGS